VVRFYGMLKNPTEYGRDTAAAKLKNISRQLSASLLGVSAGIFQRAPVDKSGMGTHNLYIYIYIYIYI
jgi:hypothetical protein